jgi:hypothetical protein
MKLAGARSNLPAARTESVGVTLSEHITAVDTTVLESMLAIRKEQARLKDYRERAKQLRDKVTEAVYQKVVDGYSDRVASLERQATPMKAQVCNASRELQALFERTTLSQEEARGEVQELEFRHAVGELDAAQLAERMQEPKRIIEEGRAELAVIEQLKVRFSEIFEQNEDVNAGAQQEQRGPLPRQRAASSDTTMTTAEPSDQPAPIPFDQRPDSVASTLAPLESRLALSGPTEGSEASTFPAPIAALIVVGSDVPSAEYRLGALTYLGRSEDNQIQIVEPRASRRHALVAVTADGYTLKDLQSQNGTFVNGERIKERLLSDGDRIGIGDIQMIFRSPWGGRVTR